MHIVGVCGIYQDVAIGCGDQKGPYLGMADPLDIIYKLNRIPLDIDIVDLIGGIDAVRG
ncbi:MAG: hypothetical protein ACI9XC_000737 [Gammaproteobacteria bacterium]